MTSTVTDVTRDLILSKSVETLTTSIGVVAVVLLIVLLVQEELVRVLDGPRAGKQVRALGVAIVPLFASFVVTVTTRAIDLIQR
jgi:hypothetical protein